MKVPRSPGAVEAEIAAFVAGDVTEEVSLVQKLRNDFGISPERQLRSFAPARPDRFARLELPGSRDRREPPRAFLSPDAPSSYRVLVGAFDTERAFWGAVMLDPEGNVAHQWHFDGEVEGLNDIPDELKRLYGIAFLADGSAIFTMQEQGGALFKVDACSRLIWTKPGLFHHTATATADGRMLWTFGGDQGDLHPTLIAVDPETGDTIRKIDMVDVERANPDILIFDLQREAGVPHATHPNDIDPLPARLAAAFPRFDQGDLLLSYHTTNLVFVLDPETLEIKWWYVGAVDGQHDPDWQADGTISVYNNNYRAARRGAPLTSTIVSIDPRAHAHEVILEGSSHDFYSRTNGHHQLTEDGTAFVTSSTQGRVFEVDLSTGKKVFDFVNAYDWQDGRTLHMSEALVVDEATARNWLSQDCPVQVANR